MMDILRVICFYDIIYRMVGLFGRCLIPFVMVVILYETPVIGAELFPAYKPKIPSTGVLEYRQVKFRYRG